MTPIPLFSIIVPARNEANYLSYCLRAIQSQRTCIPFEIIVVDNGSTDATRQIASSFPGVKVIQNVTPGLAKTRNVGANCASGEYLVFIDADCVVPDNYIEKLSAYFSSAHQTRCITGAYIYRDGGMLVKFFTETISYYYILQQFIFFITGIRMIIGGNCAFRKDAFIEIGGFNESITNINMPEDLDLAIRTASKNIHVSFIKDMAIVSSFRRMKTHFVRESSERLLNQFSLLFMTPRTKRSLAVNPVK